MGRWADETHDLLAGGATLRPFTAIHVRSRAGGTISAQVALTQHRHTKTMLVSVIILALLSLLVATEPDS
jgi:hypothetical protein